MNKVDAIKVEIGELTGWMVDEHSYPQLEVNCSKQVRPARFTHSHQETEVPHQTKLLEYYLLLMLEMYQVKGGS